MPQFLNSANFLFRSSTRLIRYYSNFRNFYVLLYICFLSLVELERWLADVTFFPSSTPTMAFQHSGHFQARFFFTRPFLTQPEGSGVQTTPISAFLSLSILENWRWGRPGNKASDGMAWNHFVLFCGVMFISLMHTCTHTHTYTQFPLWLGLPIALTWCFSVCLSRIYLGVHTVLVRTKCPPGKSLGMIVSCG